ncbi:Membrane protein insertion efficiency factor YidD [hydrothermal vent metagenome]|uniref:Membrane protein insertion efficiency factor YidD n=1 Tax=hydrothermal vent metagenome TaxID=652676 RepID=A0A3B0TCE2_9ZZZZ
MSLGRTVARALVRAYQLTFSALVGRTCRYLPTCSEYTDDAILRHGVWPGLWMGLARIGRCRPKGGSGYDPVPDVLPQTARPWAPWRYGDWAGRNIKVSLED